MSLLTKITIVLLCFSLCGAGTFHCFERAPRRSAAKSERHSGEKSWIHRARMDCDLNRDRR
ncbi:MAG: hypothetical protein DMF28_04875 [Verrucomicrobia bacterium]|nr:MAG: hypothetical protein DMF28_04875 [Verrucomicrobiota bacterium]